MRKLWYKQVKNIPNLTQIVKSQTYDFFCCWFLTFFQYIIYAHLFYVQWLALSNNHIKKSNNIFCLKNRFRKIWILFMHFILKHKHSLEIITDFIKEMSCSQSHNSKWTSIWLRQCKQPEINQRVFWTNLCISLVLEQWFDKKYCTYPIDP